MKENKEEKINPEIAKQEEELQVLQSLENLTNEEIISKTKMFESNIRAMTSEMRRYDQDRSKTKKLKSKLIYFIESLNEKIKENKEKIKLNKQLPYLVSNIVEVTI